MIMLKRLIDFFQRRAPAGSFIANVITLVSGTTLAQIILIAAAPLLTRLFSPTEFGVFAVYFSLVTLLSVIASGRYELAIILPAGEEEAANVVALSLLTATTTSIASFFILLIFASDIVAALHLDGTEKWLLLIPPAVLLTGYYQCLYCWANRRKQYKLLAQSRIVQNLLAMTSSIAFGLAGAGLWGLIWGVIVGQGCALAVFRKEVGYIFQQLRQEISAENICKQAKAYKDFPRYMVAAHLLNTGATHVPVFLLTHYYGSLMVGFFSLAQRMTSVPSAVVGQAVGEVFRQRASLDYNRHGNCAEIFGKTFKKLIIFSAVPAVILYCFAPELFSLFLGSDWRISGEFTRIMVYFVFLQLIASPLSSVFLIAEKQRAFLVSQALLFIGIIVAIPLGYYGFQAIEYSLGMYTAVYCLMYISVLALSYRFARGNN